MSIYERKKKDGSISFDITVYDGYQIDEAGNYVQKRKYKTFSPPKDMGIRKARKMAKEIETEMQFQFEKQQNLGSEKRLSEVWDWYKTYYAPNNLRDATFIGMENIVNSKILPKLGHLRIGDITTNRVTMFLNEISIMTNPKTGKPLKPKQYYKDSYVKEIYSMLSRLLNISVTQGWIKDNPCKNAIKPKKNRSKKLPPLEPEQIQDILHKTEEFDVYNAIIRFQIYTGMRIGETLALTWDNINFNKRTITINKTVNFPRGGAIVGPPKTENSYRTLGMSDSIYNLLKMVKEEQNERKVYLKNVYQDKNLVFSNPFGDFIHRNSVGTRLNKIKKGTDYEYITVHFLRHVNATLLLMNNIDIKVVSAHLGHNDISTTADIYADVLNSMNQKVAQLIDFDLNKLK